LNLHYRGFDDDWHEEGILEFFILLDEFKDHFLINRDALTLESTQSSKELDKLEIASFLCLFSYGLIV